MREYTDIESAKLACKSAAIEAELAYQCDPTDDNAARWLEETMQAEIIDLFYSNIEVVG